MSHIVTVQDKQTGDSMGRIDVQVQSRPGGNYKAMISWDGICTIEHGATESEAVQTVYKKFSRLPVLGDYEMKLVSSAG